MGKSKLDQSLGDIIKSEGPVRKFRKNNRATPYKKGNSSAGNRVYVGNLSYETEWQDLKDHMRSAGPVSFVEVLRFDDNKSKGCAIVEFETAKAAKAAIRDLHDTEVDGRLIFLREDREAKGSGGGGSRDGNSRANGGGRGGGNYGAPVFAPNSNMSRKIRDKAGPGCIVKVGNLPYSAEWQELKDICSKFGKVGRADVEEKADGKSQGWGIAIFENKKSAAKCVRELNGATFGDRELNVSLLTNNNKGATYTTGHRGPRNGGGGGGGGGGKSFGKGKFTLSRPGGGGGGRGGSGGVKKVFVGNLPWAVEWQDLKDLCKTYGDVNHADVPTNDEGRSRGFGLVEFANMRDAKKCINQLHGMLLDGRDLEVHFDNK